MAYTTIALNAPHKIDNIKGTGAIYPGMLLEPYVGTLRIHATTGGTAFRLVALEDDLKGNDVDDVYTTANQIRAGWFLPGDDVVLLLASGVTVADGTLVESDGAGSVKLVSSDVLSYQELSSVVGIAREIKTYSAATIAGRGVRVTLI